MAYSKQTWATGDTITAAKLNHMEDGIANNGEFRITFNVAQTESGYACDKTYAEVVEAYQNGMTLVVYVEPAGVEDTVYDVVPLTFVESWQDDGADVISYLYHFEAYLTTQLGTTNIKMNYIDVNISDEGCEYIITPCKFALTT